MSEQIKLISIDVSTHCHATENISIVKKALCTIIPISIENFDEQVEPLVFEGDYGNKITVLNLSFKKKRDTGDIINGLKEMLPEQHKKVIGDNLEAMCREGKVLYLRINKQALLSGKTFLSQASDIIHIKIKFGIYSTREQEERLTLARQYLLDAGLIC